MTQLGSSSTSSRQNPRASCYILLPITVACLICLRFWTMHGELDRLGRDVEAIEAHVMGRVWQSNKEAGQEEEKILAQWNPSHCWLSPAWGTNNNTVVDEPQSRVCADRIDGNPKRLANPYTTATTLSCAANVISDARSLQEEEENDPKTKKDHRITIILLYYANPARLLQQLKYFSNLSEHLRRQLVLLIVDDGSPHGLQAKEYLEPALIKPALLEIRLLRITVDIPWNMPGSQNLGVFQATTTRIVLLDLDTILPVSTLENMTSLLLPSTNQRHQEQVTPTNSSSSSSNLWYAYQFFIANQQGLHRHNKMVYCTKDLYFRVGGFDEDFVPRYGLDDKHFWHRVALHPQVNLVEATSKTPESQRLYVKIKWDAIDPCDNTTLLQLMKSANPSVTTTTTTTTTTALIHSACQAAISNLQSPPKDPNSNRRLLGRNWKSNCMSNDYLRFKWIEIDL